VLFTTVKAFRRKRLRLFRPTNANDKNKTLKTQETLNATTY